jgi:alkanesulfonate monooxygenase SsuD/methylene tetrahydromethanopterin reductase-like flavin-dependent oxidoreductase (luciferase family)
MYGERGLPILADPAATFRKVVKAAETWQETAARAGHPAGAELVVARSVYVAPTVRQAREDQARFEAAFDRSRIFNERSAPIDPRTGRAAQGFEFYQDRYLKGGSVSADFRWEQLEVIGDPARVVAQISLLRDAGFANLLCDFGSTRPMPLEEMKKVMRFFAAEVMPAFA